MFLLQASKASDENFWLKLITFKVIQSKKLRFD